MASNEELVDFINEIFPDLNQNQQRKALDLLPYISKKKDERIRHAIQVAIDISVVNNHAVAPGLCVSKEQALDWLRNSRRVQWTDEDDQVLNSVIWHIRNSVNNGDLKASGGRVEAWIKEIKERLSPN